MLRDIEQLQKKVATSDENENTLLSRFTSKEQYVKKIGIDTQNMDTDIYTRISSNIESISNVNELIGGSDGESP